MGEGMMIEDEEGEEGAGAGGSGGGGGGGMVGGSGGSVLAARMASRFGSSSPPIRGKKRRGSSHREEDDPDYFMKFIQSPEISSSTDSELEGMMVNPDLVFCEDTSMAMAIEPSNKNEAGGAGTHEEEEDRPSDQGFSFHPPEELQDEEGVVGYFTTTTSTAAALPSTSTRASRPSARRKPISIGSPPSSAPVSEGISGGWSCSSSTLTLSNSNNALEGVASTDPFDFPELRGRYRVLEKIGEGSYSSVYKAIDLQSNAVVALKRIVPFSSPSRIASEVRHLKTLG